MNSDRGRQWKIMAPQDSVNLAHPRIITSDHTHVALLSTDDGNVDSVLWNCMRRSGFRLSTEASFSLTNRKCACYLLHIL